MFDAGKLRSVGSLDTVGQLLAGQLRSVKSLRKTEVGHW